MRGHTLGQSFGICYQKTQPAALQPRQAFDAQNLCRRIGLAVFYVAFEARGHDCHFLFRKQAAEVEEEVPGVVGIVADHHYGVFSAAVALRASLPPRSQTIAADTPQPQAAESFPVKDLM